MDHLRRIAQRTDVFAKQVYQRFGAALCDVTVPACAAEAFQRSSRLALRPVETSETGFALNMPDFRVPMVALGIRATADRVAAADVASAWREAAELVTESEELVRLANAAVETVTTESQKVVETVRTRIIELEEELATLRGELTSFNEQAGVVLEFGTAVVSEAEAIASEISGLPDEIARRGRS